MQHPLRGAAPALPDDERAQLLARFALFLAVGISPKSAEFAARKARDLFALDIPESDIKGAQLALVTEATAGISALRRPEARKP